MRQEPAAADPRDDHELLRAHVSGDRAAFDTLVRRHADRLWAVALRTLGDREEAADAVQDALLSAYRNADRFRGDSAVTTWLHRIVVNACLDRVRRRRARPTVPLPESGPAEPVSTEPDTADSDTALTVQAALTELPVEQRAALVLVDVYGYPVGEAARILQIAEGTVKSRCARGRARLAGRLGHLRNRAPSPDVESGTAQRSDTAQRTGASDRAPGTGPPAQPADRLDPAHTADQETAPHRRRGGGAS